MACDMKRDIDEVITIEDEIRTDVPGDFSGCVIVGAGLASLFNHRILLHPSLPCVLISFRLCFRLARSVSSQVFVREIPEDVMTVG